MTDLLAEILRAEVKLPALGPVRVGTMYGLLGVVALAIAALRLSGVGPLQTSTEARRWYAGECVPVASPGSTP